MGESQAAERHQFSAEVGRLLDLVVHSLYSDREIFLRELVANAADAIDRRRFEALTNPAVALPPDAKVRIVPDKAARTLLIADAGIGMDKGELAANLGTIARSGTRAFGEKLAKEQVTPAEAPPMPAEEPPEPVEKPAESLVQPEEAVSEAKDPEQTPEKVPEKTEAKIEEKVEEKKVDNKVSLIGQFGVGFYSAFMVADRVEVTSRRAGSEEAWTWASDGGGAFTLAPGAREESGTTIVMHMKTDADDFLEPIRLETIVRKWADHITIPIVIARDGEDRPANEGTALWRKAKAEITEDQYKEFYHHVAHAWDDPWSTLHWRAEGAIDYSALLFIPSVRPFDAMEGPRESRVRLHVRRMFITDEASLLPSWARFVQGVVDTEDLPLNVSREMLQATPVLARIRKAVANRVLSELKARSADAEAYAKFWTQFGSILKEGVWDDAEHRKEVAALMRFKSSAVEGWTSLADYVGRMKEAQEAIYVLSGDDAAALGKSPQLEGFRARAVEVLLLTDPVDAFWPERLGEWEGKKLRSVTQGAEDLTKLAPETAPEGEPANVEKLIPALKAALAEGVTEIRTTDRLVDSAVVLAANTVGPDLQMQRLMRRHGRSGITLPPTLELNPRHPLIRRLAERAEAGEDVAEAAHTLLDLARVQDGDMPLDSAAFARRVTAALTK